MYKLRNLSISVLNLCSIGDTVFSYFICLLSLFLYYGSFVNSCVGLSLSVCGISWDKRSSLSTCYRLTVPFTGMLMAPATATNWAMCAGVCVLACISKWRYLNLVKWSRVYSLNLNEVLNYEREETACRHWVYLHATDLTFTSPSTDQTILSCKLKCLSSVVKHILLSEQSPYIHFNRVSLWCTSH